MTAGVHGAAGGRPIHPGRLDQRQCVQFGANQHSRSRGPDPHQEAGVGHPGRLESGQCVAQSVRGGAFGATEVRMAVQLSAQRQRVGHHEIKLLGQHRQKARGGCVRPGHHGLIFALSLIRRGSDGRIGQ